MDALILTADQFEDSEVLYPKYRLEEAGFGVDIATPDGEDATGKHGIGCQADRAIIDCLDSAVDSYDLLVVPGGYAPETIRMAVPEAATIVAAFDAAGKPIASICHGIQLLISAGILDGRTVTGYQALAIDIENAGARFEDSRVVIDDNLVTSRVPDDLPALLRETIGVVDGVDVPAVSAD